MHDANEYTEEMEGTRNEKDANEGRGGEEQREEHLAAPEEKADPREYPKVYTAQDIGRILKMNVDTIYRKLKSGDLPKPMTPLSRLLRWNGRLFDKWVEDGCPKLKTVRKKKAAEKPPPGAGKRKSKGKQCK